jgi:NAD(P)-dependent dehydrogenase (short-subunit alcohol dehydrogenase family)
MGVLDGKVAVITGGSRGLGLGIAKMMASEGASVVIASRSQKSVLEACDQITRAGGKAAGIPVDVSDYNQMEALLQFAIQSFQKVDIWINNAGVAGPYGATLSCSPEIFSSVVNTNIMGTYHGSRVAMKYFIPRGEGKLINILGNGWQKPVPFQNAYSSSKIWVRWFTRSLAEETKGTGVGVYALNPGMVLTDLLTDVEVFEDDQAKLDKFPMVVRVLAKPPEVPARAVVKLASAESDGKTGLEVNVFSPLASGLGFMREGIRSFLKQPEPPSNVKIKVVPPEK